MLPGPSEGPGVARSSVTRLTLCRNIAAVVVLALQCAAASVAAAPSCLHVDTVATGVAVPVVLTHAANDSRLFIASQTGVVTVHSADGTLIDTVLDISGNLTGQPGGEQGLLGMALHPTWPSPAWLFVDYTDTTGATVVARYTMANATRADLASQHVLLHVPQPSGNHNAGGIVFGPDDGYLYVTLGDGGQGGDSYGNGQDDTTLHGAILRLDVDAAPDAGKPYHVPRDNPYVFGQPEMYAIGFRNPFRCSFGRLGNSSTPALLFCGDVGESTWEEVTIIVPGGNYGWNRLEGHCGFAEYDGCHDPAMVFPIADYSHNVGSAVIGGFLIQQDSAYNASVHGRYVFGDYQGGMLELHPDEMDAATSWTLHRPCVTPPQPGMVIHSLGQDVDGRIYILTEDNRVLRITSVHPNDAAACATCEVILDDVTCEWPPIPYSSPQCVSDVPTFVPGLMIVVFATLLLALILVVATARYVPASSSSTTTYAEVPVQGDAGRS